MLTTKKPVKPPFGGSIILIGLPLFATGLGLSVEKGRRGRDEGNEDWRFVTGRAKGDWVAEGLRGDMVRVSVDAT